MLLMRHAVGAGNLREAIDQMAVLNRLNSTMVQELMAALGKAITHERQIDEAVVALEPHRELYAPFVRGLANAGKSGPLMIRLVRTMPRSALAEPETRQMAIGMLVKAGAFAEARRLWASAAPSRSGPVYSPDFSERSAPPPFNWQLEQTATGVAERRRSGGLMVEYYGRESGILAGQLLTLQPGSYRAVLDYRTESGTPGAIALQVHCAGSDVLLAQVPLTAGAGSGEKRGLGFAVPAAACAAQRLALVGLPLEERSGQAIAARRLDVSAGARP
jgi:hypothetical protein